MTAIVQTGGSEALESRIAADRAIDTGLDDRQLEAMTTATGLSAEQLHAMALILTGMGFTEAGHRIGRDRRTIWAWRQQPAFRDEYERQLAAVARGLQEETHARMLSLVGKAVGAVERALDDPGPQSLTAARFVLNRLGELDLSNPRPRSSLELDRLTSDELESKLDAELSVPDRGTEERTERPAASAALTTHHQNGFLERPAKALSSAARS